MSGIVNLNHSISGGEVSRSSIKVASHPLAEKIIVVVISIFEGLKSLVLFPTRYFGSKTWSLPGVIFRLPSTIIARIEGEKVEASYGYHFTPIKHLTRPELRPYLKHLGVTIASFKENPKWIEGLNVKLHNFKEDPIENLPANVEIREFCLYDPKSGMKLIIAENESEVIMAFGARGSGRHHAKNEKEEKMTSNTIALECVANFLGFKPEVYEQAIALINAVLKKYEGSGKKVSLTGTCFGGGIAQYVGLKLGIPTICYNSFGLGAGLQQDIGQKRLSKADDLVTHISVSRDWSSDFPGSIIADRPLNFIGIKTSGNFGKRYEIPSLYRSPFKSHDYTSTSFMAHLGYHPDAKPIDVVKNEKTDL